MRAELDGVALRARDLGPVTVPLDAAPWEVAAWPATMPWVKARERGKIRVSVTTKAELDRAAERAVSGEIVADLARRHPAHAAMLAEWLAERLAEAKP